MKKGKSRSKKRNAKNTEQLRKEALAVVSKNMAAIDAAEKRGGATADTSVATPQAKKGRSGSPKRKERRDRAPGMLDAAITVLKEAGKPLKTKEVMEVILKKGLWKTSGKTPAATLYSALFREIKDKGAEARFRKAERGTFALTKRV